MCGMKSRVLCDVTLCFSTPYIRTYNQRIGYFLLYRETRDKTKQSSHTGNPMIKE